MRDLWQQRVFAVLRRPQVRLQSQRRAMTARRDELQIPRAGLLSRAKYVDFARSGPRDDHMDLHAGEQQQVGRTKRMQTGG
jgi:hypothetical protein